MPEPFKPNSRILSAAKHYLLEREGSQAIRSNYYLQEMVLPRHANLPIPRKRVEVERPTIVSFADDAPLFNWAHPCRYLLHDAENGEIYHEVAAQFPPSAGSREIASAFSLFHEPITRAPSSIYLRDRLRITPKLKLGGNRYAVLFSGMSNNRHTNDLEFLYRTLRNIYQVPKANIYVLNHDGTLNYDGNPKPVQKWPGDQGAYQMPVTGKGSKADLLGVLDDLKKRLKADDSLLIHTNNHGGHNGTESDLCCYPNWGSLGVKAFTDKLAELPKFRCLIVMMEQCHSGGFNSSVIAKSTANATSIASACLELNNSIGGADFDPFARDWIAAMNGYDPYGNALAHNPDSDGSGKVTAKEAFNYADNIHHASDTPVFNQIHNGGGCRLGQDLLYRLPPLLLEELTRKFWPEPDPLLIEKRIASVLPALEALDKEFSPRFNGLQQKMEKKVSRIIQNAKRIK